MVRAAESIPANLAEGYGRGLTADGARLLRVARASAAELESHLLVAELGGRLPSVDVAPLVARASAAELESHLRVAGLGGRLPPDDVDVLVSRTRRVRALINGLLRFAAQRGRD